jgi:GcrA cell cycle regulator
MSFGVPAEWMTEANLARLRAEWIKGTPTAAIGRLFGVSKSAVVGKAHRLGLDSRKSPILGHVPVPRRIVPPQTRTLAPLPTERPLHDAPRPVLTAAPSIPAPSLHLQNGDECCWPIGEPKTAGFRYCDDIAEPGRPYCETHRIRSRLPTRQPAGEPAYASGDD